MGQSAPTKFSASSTLSSTRRDVYLGVALYDEGTRDHRFLGTMVRRLCEETCLAMSQKSIEVSPPWILDDGPNPPRERDQRILQAATRAAGSWHLLVVHADADGDADSARKTRIEPGLKLVRDNLPTDRRRGIGLVPVRETEAWALADGDAIRRAFAVTLTDAQLGLAVNPRNVESIADPKATLRHVLETALPNPNRRRRQLRAEDALGQIAEFTRLDRLSLVPSFKRFKRDLNLALGELGYLS